MIAHTITAFKFCFFLSAFKKCVRVPSCTALCDEPVDLVNGVTTIIGTGTSVSDTVTYTCNDGFELIGTDAAICTQTDDSAAFSSPLPECRGKSHNLLCIGFLVNTKTC